MMNQPESQEPSMEEILASIRRIISDDKRPRGPLSSEKSAPLGARSLPEDDGDILELRHPLPEDKAAPSPLLGEKAEEFSSKITPRGKISPPHAEPSSGVPSSSFVSEETIKASRAALSSLENFNPQSRRASAVNLGSRTLEDVVEGMLYPLLKEWLDHHLPSLVKQIVHEQVEKIAGRRK